jgi:hypothetical protein
MIRRGQCSRRIFVALSSCPAHAKASARRSSAAFSERYGVLNQPLAWMMMVPGAAHHNKTAKILAFTVVYIHDAS